MTGYRSFYQGRWWTGYHCAVLRHLHIQPGKQTLEVQRFFLKCFRKDDIVLVRVHVLNSHGDFSALMVGLTSRDYIFFRFLVQAMLRNIPNKFSQAGCLAIPGFETCRKFHTPRGLCWKCYFSRETLNVFLLRRESTLNTTVCICLGMFLITTVFEQISTHLMGNPQYVAHIFVLSRWNPPELNYFDE